MYGMLYSIKSFVARMSPSESYPQFKSRGGGGYSHIWAIRVCAAQQGMFFDSLTPEQGIKIAPFLWNRVYFISGLTLE